MKLNLIIPKFGLKFFLFSALALWLIAATAAYARRLAEWSNGISAALALTSFLAYFLLSILVLLGLWRLGGLLLRWAAYALATEEVEVDPEPEEQAGIEIVANSLKDALAAIETERTAATKTANDIEFLCRELALLARVFVERGEEKHRQALAMETAMRTLANRDKLSPMEYGAAIGAIPDADFRTMCQARSDNPQYWIDLFRSAGEYVSMLNEWGGGYTRYAARLVSDVARFKTRIAGVREVVSYGLAADALLSAENSLGDVAHLLEAKEEQWMVFRPDYRLPGFYRARQMAGAAPRQLEAGAR